MTVRRDTFTPHASVCRRGNARKTRPRPTPALFGLLQNPHFRPLNIVNNRSRLLPPHIGLPNIAWPDVPGSRREHPHENEERNFNDVKASPPSLSPRNFHLRILCSITKQRHNRVPGRWTYPKKRFADPGHSARHPPHGEIATSTHDGWILSFQRRFFKL